jgi:flavodoxin
MKAMVLYFSRTGNTKRLAEAISDFAKAPIFDIAAVQPSVMNDADVVIIGTPTEGSRPTQEVMAFISRLPKVEGKKTILFCTCRLWVGGTLKTMEKALSDKGYNTVLSVSKKGMTPEKTADFSEVLKKIGNALV